MFGQKRGEVDELNATAQEFFDAQEPKHPGTLIELRDASTQAFDSAVRTLGNTESLEEWISATNSLNVAFFELHNGALGEQIRMLVEKETLNAAEWTRSEKLIRQTAAVAARMFPIIHRLQILGFAPTREEVVRKLEVGELPSTTRIHSVSIVPRRRTIIGLLRDLDSKIGANIWSLEFPPQLPSKVVVSDPFDEDNEPTRKLWSGRREVSGKINPNVEHSILTISGDITTSAIYELNEIGERTSDPILKESAEAIVAWLNRKSVYYQDPDKRDFALYHLGMEQPDDLMQILRSLDVIKHADPELFLELLGINPSNGGNSPYFGSFLHKALFNTQKAVVNQNTLGEVAIKKMLDQLLTLDATVSTYSGVVSQEAMKAMGAQIREKVDAEETATEKAKTLLMLAIPFSHLAIDAEIRRQLDELREADFEGIKEDFLRHLNDINHPLKFVDYLRTMPRAAFNDDEIITSIRDVFKYPELQSINNPDSIYAWVHERLNNGNYDFIAPLYQRIPLLDESEADLGYGKRLVVAIRDINSLERLFSRSIATSEAESFRIGKARLELFVGDEMLSFTFTKEAADAVSSQLSFIERRFLNDTVEKNIADGLGYKKHPIRDFINQHSYNPRTLDPYVFSQMLVEEPATRNDSRVIGILEAIPNPEVALLSILSHPNGVEVAFEHFDIFCDRIPVNKMITLLHDSFSEVSHPALKRFYSLFMKMEPTAITNAYVKYLRRQIQGQDRSDGSYEQSDIALHLALNRALVEKCTPWTVTILPNKRALRDSRPDTIISVIGIDPLFTKDTFNEMRTFDFFQTIADSKKNTVKYLLSGLKIPDIEEFAWGEREINFVKKALNLGNRMGYVTNTAKQGIILQMRSPNSQSASDQNTLVLHLKKPTSLSSQQTQIEQE